MSIKSQLNSTRDFLMVGIRASSRVSAQKPQAEKVLQACLDMVETLGRRPTEIDVTEIEMTLSVMHKAVTELDDDTAGTRAVVSSMQNAAPPRPTWPSIRSKPSSPLRVCIEK